MCLKYFVEHATCDHHEYLGSHHCSTTPCGLDTQHFLYIKDSFPVPWSPSLQLNFRSDRSALACNTCATKHSDKLDPDEVPVQHYSPIIDFEVKEIRPTEYCLPINVVRVEIEDVEDVEDEDCEYDYDYKNLSDADEEEWRTSEGEGETTEVHTAQNEILTQTHRDFIQNQLKDLPNYLAQQRQIPPGPAPEAYAMGNYLHYPMPHMAYLAPPSNLGVPLWHGNATVLSSVQTVATAHRSDGPQPQLLPSPVRRNAVEPTTAAVLPQRPATPPPSPPIHPLPPRPTPPFIVGSITDAYLRMEAAKRRHMRERARRAKSSLRDALPARSMALTDFMVNRRNRKGHHKDVDAAQDIELDTWSSLPFAGEHSDTEGGAEEYTESVERAKVTCIFSCRLVTSM